MTACLYAPMQWFNVSHNQLEGPFPEAWKGLGQSRPMEAFDGTVGGCLACVVPTVVRRACHYCGGGVCAYLARQSSLP